MAKRRGGNRRAITYLRERNPGRRRRRASHAGTPRRGGSLCYDSGDAAPPRRWSPGFPPPATVSPLRRRPWLRSIAFPARASPSNPKGESYAGFDTIVKTQRTWGVRVSKPRCLLPPRLAYPSSSRTRLSSSRQSVLPLPGNGRGDLGGALPQRHALAAWKHMGHRRIAGHWAWWWWAICAWWAERPDDVVFGPTNWKLMSGKLDHDRNLLLF